MKDYSLILYKDMHSCAEDWALLEKLAPCYPFQSYRWCCTLVDTLLQGIHHQICIFVVSDKNKKPLLLAPLYVKSVKGVRVAGFIDCGLADLNAPLLAPGAPAFEPQWILQMLRSSLAYDVLNFSKIPQYLADGRANPFSQMCKGKHGMMYSYVVLDQTWKEFRTRRLKRKTRQKINYLRNRLSRQGEVNIEVAQTPERAVEITQKLLDLKLVWLRQKQIASIIGSEAVQRFYLRLVLEGIAHVAALTLDGAVLAAYWGVIRQGRSYYLVTAYDMSASNFSPGRLLLMELLRICIEQGCDRFELSIGDYEYKKQLMDGQMSLYRHVFAGSLLGRPAVAKFWLKEVVMRNDRLRHWVVRLKRTVQNMRSAS